MLHAVIMAGGFGTRFWPLSRTQRPKQLLPLSGSRTMIQATVARLGSLVAADRVLVMTNQTLVGPIAEQLPKVPKQAILGEPCKRDTAPCIGWAAALIQQHDPDATLVVMPSDHVIQNEAAFQAAVAQAVALVAEQPGRIVTFGIKPTYPAEIFGYIERGERLSVGSSEKSPAATYRVVKFREKPPTAVAQEYVDSGKFYWNSGIFVWKSKTILDALQKQQPEMFARLQTIVAAAGTPAEQSVLDHEFTAIRGISIDFAVMEHATDVAVIEAPFDWDDVGGWQSLTRLHGTDANGNTIIGQHLGLNTTGSIIRSEENHLIVTLGLRDCLIVHTPDATLVANKHDEEAIRQVVKQMEERGWSQYL
jgi:mannose-1-phosphate guanylyltransferase